MEVIRTFLLGVWLWGMSWGVIQMLLSAALMAVLFRFIVGLSLVRAFFFAVLSAVTSWSVCTALSFSLLFISGFYRIPSQELRHVCSFTTLSFYMVIVAWCIQTLVFLALNRRYVIPVALMSLVAFASGMMALWMMLLALVV